MTFGDADHDDFVQMLLRFHDALQKGSSARNLRLLGRLIVGLKADGSFHLDEYAQLAGALEGLTLVELELLAKLYRLSLEHGFADRRALWKGIHDGIDGEQAPEILHARSGSLLKTGFVTAESGFGRVVFLPAPTLMKLGELAKWPKLPRLLRKADPTRSCRWF